MPLVRVRRLAAALGTVAVVAGCSATPPSTPPSAPAATPPQPPHSELPSPDAPTQPPAGSVTADALPRAAEIAGPVAGTWTETATGTASPPKPISACQLSKWEGLGATALHVRTYAGPGGMSAGAVVMSFDSEATAAAARDTLLDWRRGCAEVVRSNGGTDFAVTEPSAAKTIAGASATVDEVAWAAQGGRQTEGQGAVVKGNRLLVVIEQGAGSKTLDGITRTLSAVAPRLG